MALNPIADQIKKNLGDIDIKQVLSRLHEKSDLLHQKIHDMHKGKLSKTINELNALMLEISQLQQIATLKIAVAHEILEQAILDSPQKDVLMLLEKIKKTLN